MIDPIEVPTVLAVGVDLADDAGDTMVVVRHVHRRHVIADHLPDVALCVYGESQEGIAATVEDWEVAFDLWEEDGLPADDPSYWWRPGPLCDDPATVTCPACKEWMGA